MSEHAFTLKSEIAIAELNAMAKLWVHPETGAQLLSFITEDENKVFGVTFRTPPEDSTGVAHILEHSVLCGSEKFPVKEPFVELLKGSLQTFLNAFTYPDKTCYPVASTNRKDFYNLIDVYLDAVFFPRLRESIFQQEGWHLEVERPNGPVLFKGVVYNEMKGVYSSPESLLGEQSQQSVFPDTTYGLDSGGKPDQILRLTFEQFMNFHATRYHPANARFFFWGDDPEEKRLAIVTELLERVGAKEGQDKKTASDIAGLTRVPLQSPLELPRHIEVPFAASEDEQRGMVTLNWLLSETTDIDLNYALTVLEHILLGLPGSPLRKALIESGLGEDVAGAGLETELRQIYFSVGLKGIQPGDVPAVETLIMETLADLAEEGVGAAAIEAAVNSLEFELRENNAGRFPVGLAIMLRSLTTWLYDADPLALLAFEPPLRRLKERLAGGEKVFENLIRTWLLDNSHRATVVLLPDHQLAARLDAEESARIAQAFDPLGKAERKALVEESRRLQELQGTPDSPEALATIPSLVIDDLPRENALIPSETLSAPVPVLFHALPTSGIVYADAAFDLSSVPARLIPLIPLLGRAFFEMDTKRRDFIELGMHIAAKTGGMDASPLFAAVLPASASATHMPVARLLVQGKATLDKAPALFDLFAETLTETRLDDRERFSRMVLEEKARHEHSLLPRGNAVVSARLAAGLTTSGWLVEQTDGVSYLFFLRALSERVNADWPGLLADLETLREHIVRRSSCLFNVTAREADRGALPPLIARLSAGLPEKTFPPAADWPQPQSVSHRNTRGEALIMPAQVNYVGKALNLHTLGYAFHGSLAVVLRHLRMAYLWESVRVRGGAYGAGCGFNRLTGTLSFSSYRDPNIERTLKIYDNAAGYLKKLHLSDRELQRAIIGAVGDLDAHLLPDAKGSASLLRSLTRDTVEIRQRMREEMLSTSMRHFSEAAELLNATAKLGRIAILGGAALEGSAERLQLEKIRLA